jgi:hypothetical protein
MSAVHGLRVSPLVPSTRRYTMNTNPLEEAARRLCEELESAAALEPAAPLPENVDGLALDLDDAAFVVGLPEPAILRSWLKDHRRPHRTLGTALASAPATNSVVHGHELARFAADQRPGARDHVAAARAFTRSASTCSTWPPSRRSL